MNRIDKDRMDRTDREVRIGWSHQEKVESRTTE